MRRAAWMLLLVVLVLAGCRPTLDDRPWLIREPQILAVTLEPPEAPPGTEIVARAFALDPAGPADTSAAAWSFCRVPKPLGENRPVATPCLEPAPSAAVGDPATLTLPADGCTVFGPDTPQPKPGAPPTRPRDPDQTGGYFQPLTVGLGDVPTLARARLICGLPDASLAIARAFQTSYRANQNPTIASVTVEPSVITAGGTATITVTWAEDAAEAFPVFDRAASALVDTRETLTVSWYVTGGALDRAAVQVSEPATGATATWTAPDAPGVVELLVVLRDSRGGTDAARVALVAP